MNEVKDLFFMLCLKPSRVAINSQMCLGIFRGNMTERTVYVSTIVLGSTCLSFVM